MAGVGGVGVGVGGWMWVAGGGLGGGGEEGRTPARPTKTVAKTATPRAFRPPYPILSQIELDMVAETLVASPILIDLGIDGDGLSSLFNYQPRFLG